jgi:hypothetical protein
MTKVYVLEISFPLAFFKVPYTIKNRNTLFIPRKKSIVSIFNAFFNDPLSFWIIKKRRRKKKCEEENKKITHYLVGAEIISNVNKTIELQRIVQVKEVVAERIISSTELLFNVKYRLYLAAENILVNSNPVNYYPFAGQNDYLADYWNLYTKNFDIIVLKNQKIKLDFFQLVDKNFIEIEKDAEILREDLFDNYIAIRGNVYIKNEVKALKDENGKYILLF